MVVAVSIELDAELTEQFVYEAVGSTVDGYILIENTIVDIGRWSYTHRIIVADDNANFWMTTVEEPATEMQEGSFDELESYTWIKVRRTTPATWNWETAR